MSGNSKGVLQASAATSSTTVAIASHDLNGAQINGYFPSKSLVDRLKNGSPADRGEREKYAERSFNRDTYNRNTHFAGRDRVYSIDDEEIDEPPVPIPSTWRQTKKRHKKSWIAAQIKSSAHGFIVGLFIVVPAIMLLTMAKDNRWLSDLTIVKYAHRTSNELGNELGLNFIVSPFGFDKTQEKARQSNGQAQRVADATSLQMPSGGTAPDLSGNNASKAAEILNAAAVGSSFAKAQKAIDEGRMPEAQVILAKLASLGDSEAVFVLAETFDPNVLAARNLHGRESDVEKAKIFYSMALSQGIEKARMRLKALE